MDGRVETFHVIFPASVLVSIFLASCVLLTTSWLSPRPALIAVSFPAVGVTGAYPKKRWNGSGLSDIKRPRNTDTCPVEASYKISWVNTLFWCIYGVFRLWLPIPRKRPCSNMPSDLMMTEHREWYRTKTAFESWILAHVDFPGLLVIRTQPRCVLTHAFHPRPPDGRLR